MQSELVTTVADLGKPVAVLVETMWQEALGQLEQVIAVPLTHIKVEQVGGSTYNTCIQQRGGGG